MTNTPGDHFFFFLSIGLISPPPPLFFLRPIIWFVGCGPLLLQVLKIGSESCHLNFIFEHTKTSRHALVFVNLRFLSPAFFFTISTCEILLPLLFFPLTTTSQSPLLFLTSTRESPFELIDILMRLGMCKLFLPPEYHGLNHTLWFLQPDFPILFIA